MDDEHLQEFYDIEWYWAYADYRDNMKLVRELFLEIAKKVYGKTDFETRGHKFDLADEWKEIDYATSIKDNFDIDIFKDSDEKILDVIKKNNIEMGGEVNRNRIIDTLWKDIRTKVSGPAFLVNQPKFISPLAKSHEDNEELTQRFQVIIAGSELGNGYSEINDPQDQLERFLEQQELRESGDDEAHMLDIDFVEMLEYGMPPVSGYGHSERIFWFMEDVTAREGTFFPQMRIETENLTKEIYKDKVKFEDVKKKKK
jgi:lysyl-tRNA synthetase class 2